MRRFLLVAIHVAAFTVLLCVPAFADGPSRQVTLAADTGQARGIAASWQERHVAGVVLAPDVDDLPLTISSVSCRLASCEPEPPAEPEQKVTLQALVYSITDNLPDAVLASSALARADLTAGEVWFTYTLSTALVLTDTTPFLVAIAYHSGISGTAPSLVTDNQFDLPDATCHYRGEAGEWLTHTDWWRDPANTGMPMIRAYGMATQDPAYRMTERLVADRDTYFGEGFPDEGYPAHDYIEAGSGPGGVFGAVRAMVGFPALEPPAQEATIRSATLMLANNRSLSEEVDGLLTVHAAVRAWEEDAACWDSDADNAGDSLATRHITGRERLVVPDSGGQKVNGWLTFDITEQAQAWLDDPASNHGVQLRGDEDTPSSGRFFRSREYELVPSYCPQIVIEWSWPDPEFTRRALVPLIVR